MIKNVKWLLLVVNIPFMLKAQNLLPEKDGKVMFEQIDSFPGLSKKDIYNKSKIWLTDVFRSSKALIQLDDLENGQIIGKGNFDYLNGSALYKAKWTCFFTVRIDIKDGKSRIRFYDITSESQSIETAENFNKYASHSKRHIEEINKGFASMMYDFKNAMLKKKEDF